MRRHRSTQLAGLALLGVLGGCTQSSSEPAFDDAKGAPVSCMAHQRHEPTRDYTAGSQANTQLVLSMLRYYSANAMKGYCDRKPATAIDRTWANLYVKLGASPEQVAGILASK
ncbi:MAG: hypothetical protein M3Z02_01355 [Actinomycetota bacterium]|nr:hypothetical protein [Actinomycetota bacterium]